MESSEKSRQGLGFVGGAVLGVALVALLGLGWVLGSRGEGETVGEEVVAAAERQPGAASGPSPHADVEPIVEGDPVLERLRAELEADPARTDQRQKLALELLRRAQFFAAFEEAERVLAIEPDSIDALFVVGAVRVRMGQPSRALPLLDRVLEQVPDHVPAMTAKGQALLKAGHAQQAVAVWNRALQLSGGSNAQVEELLRTVPTGAAAPHPTPSS